MVEFVAEARPGVSSLLTPCDLSAVGEEGCWATHAFFYRAAVRVCVLGEAEAVFIVGNEGDRVVVASKGGSAETDDEVRLMESGAQPLSPREAVSSMVDFVQHDACFGGKPAEEPGLLCNLLIRNHEAVVVAG